MSTHSKDAPMTNTNTARKLPNARELLTAAVKLQRVADLLVADAISGIPPEIDADEDFVDRVESRIADVLATVRHRDIHGFTAEMDDVLSHLKPRTLRLYLDLGGGYAGETPKLRGVPTFAAELKRYDADLRRAFPEEYAKR